MKLKRDILLFAAVAVAAVAGGWWLLAKRPGAAIEAFSQDLVRREEAGRPHTPAANAFRATVCPGEACVAVEVGGLTFVFGAGAGAADGLRALGLLHPAIDGILLSDVQLETVEGLAALARSSGAAGRRDPLKVFAPSRALSVVDGANLLASGAPAPRLTLSPEGPDQGLEGKLAFDSGVVEIRSFGTSDRAYRIDFDGKSLILAGCSAGEADILAATRGTRVAAGVVTAGSLELLAGKTPRCTDIRELLEGGRQARLAAVLIVPGDPGLTMATAEPAWREVISTSGMAGATPGLGYARIDLSGPEPKASNGR